MFFSSSASSTGNDQISRNSLAWLLVTQFFIVIPHFISAPLWIAVVWVAVAVWRWKIFVGAWNYPRTLHKTVITLTCAVGLLVSFQTGFGFEFMVSLLLVGFILKLLEMKKQKDFILLVYIGLFILSTQFIEYSQLFMVIYAFGCLLLLCATSLQLYQVSAAKVIAPPLRTCFVILLQSIPFMLVLFVAVPRLGSFWSVPSPQHAKTGMSDSMSPGDFTELMESDELAFRVVFQSALPPRDKWYWRSLVLSSFNGRRWSQSSAQLVQRNMENVSQYRTNFRKHVEYVGNPVEYDVITEPSGQPWLVALAAPQVWSPELLVMRDLRMQAANPAGQSMKYHVTSALNYRLHEINESELSQNRQLPDTGNPKTREIAQAWLAETGSAEKLMDKLFQSFHADFFYTLRPPALGTNAVDDFLWKTRQGFCEHYAGSFVFFMRAAGIPARVVVGYLGGDINSVEGYVAVHQRDAHAWAEVWLEDKGWVMVDPTAAVSPERVSKGISDSLDARDQQLLGRSFGSSIKLLARLHDQWDAVNFQWTRWVMNYEGDVQTKLLERVFGDSSPLRIAFWVLMAGMLSLLVVFLLLIRRPRRARQTFEASFYQSLAKKLAPTGLAPVSGETLGDFVRRVVALRPDLNEPLTAIVRSFETLIYSASVMEEAERKRFMARLKQAIATLVVVV